ncbi:hypothetical protein GDO86_013898 [Hymenochirus boettgeri]|uniref:Uncharacterized protein n=1 Tax=Hymenochirus boettgeri TaxID=247094 RepID=A0A8T2JS45_9PIPI|nr:hypothetical protein GDO86_013898 [Hymenochirus boettgeri]
MLRPLQQFLLGVGLWENCTGALQAPYKVNSHWSGTVFSQCARSRCNDKPPADRHDLLECFRQGQTVQGFLFTVSTNLQIYLAKAKARFSTVTS